MPEHLRSLVVILVMVTIVFGLAHRSASQICGNENYKRRRNLWYLLTLAAFLSQNFWIYVLIAIPSLIYARRRERNPAALFFSLMFVLPVGIVLVPGMGVVSYIFELSNLRLLEIVILLPSFLYLRKQPGSMTFGRSGTDKTLAAYFLLSAIIYLRDTTMFDALRQTFYLFIDMFLPYYVCSRALKNIDEFRDAIFSLVLSIIAMAPLAVFETVKKWLLYTSISQVLQFEGQTGYLARDDLLRAMVMTGQPIVLGFIMTVAIGFYIFLHPAIQSKFIRRLGLLALFAGLVAALSRGPWIGTVFLVFVFIITGRQAIQRVMKMAFVIVFALSLISVLPGGEKVINLLPFIGKTEQGNVDYREQLLTNSIIVIKRNLLLGTAGFMNTPEMEAMRQGQGIIDVVNSYIGIALSMGITGLGIFLAIFIFTLNSVHRSMHLIQVRESEEYLLGRVLLAIILAMLLIIFTVSSITFIPTIYWSVAGIAMAYVQMMNKFVKK